MPIPKVIIKRYPQEHTKGMKDLKCALRDCKYNKGYCCVSKKIGVDQNTDCLTYSPSEEKKKAIFEGAEDFAPANYSVDTKIECDAKCLFNKNNHCIANGITVMSADPNKAMCMSFIKE